MHQICSRLKIIINSNPIAVVVLCSEILKWTERQKRRYRIENKLIVSYITLSSKQSQITSSHNGDHYQMLIQKKSRRVASLDFKKELVVAVEFKRITTYKCWPSSIGS